MSCLGADFPSVALLLLKLATSTCNIWMSCLRHPDLWPERQIPFSKHTPSGGTFCAILTQGRYSTLRIQRRCLNPQHHQPQMPTQAEIPRHHIRLHPRTESLLWDTNPFLIGLPRKLRAWAAYLWHMCSAVPQLYSDVQFAVG